MLPLLVKTVSSGYGKSSCSEGNLPLKSQLSQPPPLRLNTMTQPMAICQMGMQSPVGTSQTPAHCMRVTAATALSCNGCPTGFTRAISRMYWSFVGPSHSLYCQRLWTKQSSCGTSAWTSVCGPSSKSKWAKLSSYLSVSLSAWCKVSCVHTIHASHTGTLTKAHVPFCDTVRP